MPTENRSSNTEMAAKLSPCPYCGQQDAFVEQLDSDASVVICPGRIDEHSACLARGPVGVQQHECEDQPGHDQAVKEWNKRAAAQNHPAPIAWMVGTAFWWTKEEAERDAAATGLPIVGLGSMAGVAPAEQRQDEPAAWLNTATGAVTSSPVQVMDWDDESEPVQALYTHADPAELERLTWEQIVALVNEVLGCEAHKWPVHDVGHQMTDINFNSLARIIDRVQRLRPAHADPAEVERLRLERRKMDQALSARANERDALRAKLAERDALLADISKRHWSGVDFDLPADLVDRMKALSASA
ncbi:hypothetical protein [Pseudomonas fulva]|uniref:hypothetical protein n=1 Tax=Pseudomonas fulva TaxID=47880 RepID=UPI002DB75A71|nr:hypothetical protein [Pseudomonas fulva]MEB8055763.1 hypothetical protein [Pseudomonas fulva]